MTFLHLSSGPGRITIAINENHDLVHIGAAFCSPQDQFMKEYGRELALERLNNKKDFYVCFKRNKSQRLKFQVSSILMFIVSGKWVTKFDIENELDTIVYEIITETANDFPNDIAPMIVHTNTVPTWAKHAVIEKTFTKEDK